MNFDAGYFRLRLRYAGQVGGQAMQINTTFDFSHKGAKTQK
jgi:hypothetical protein